MSARGESELVVLRRLAEDLAKQRKERATTGHLLAAIASRPSQAADLLRERRLDTEVLLKAARVQTDDATDAISRALQRAREFAARSSLREAGALHLLFALCQERGTSAYRAIEQCGSDVVKLRTIAMQVVMGIVSSRRPTALQSQPPKAVRLPPVQPKAVMPVSSIPPITSLGTVRVIPQPPSQVTPIVPTIPLRSEPKSDTVVRVKQKPRVVVTHAQRDVPPSPFALDPKRFPTLCQFGRNLTIAAAENQLDRVVGREAEIERTLDVLAKRAANNPCLVGAAGVGKTSVVRGLAQRIASGIDIASLDDRIVIEIEPAALLAGTAVRGALAERIAQLRAEVARANGRVVIFFDEIHTLFGPDAGEEASQELKTAFARGELPCIGATTSEDYRRVIDSDPALSRRFSAIEVVELSPDEAMLALEGITPAFEKHHGVRYIPQALAACVTWTSRYMQDRALPDKAVNVLDLAGARARRRSESEVGREQVAEVVAELTDVPLERLLETDGDRMLRIEQMLGEKIVGHSDKLEKIAAILRRNASGFRSQRPIGSFLLLGPTGVGKTETAKAIAECLFHSPHAMTRLDMSEYAEPHAIARLVGAPPGYVGHEAGGHLTEAVRTRPYQVILLDEIEKAHRDVLEAFLQVFDEGRLTDGRGRTVDFTNTVILMTSNLGADVARPSASRGRIGFGVSRASNAHLVAYENAVVQAAREALPPELYNRLDEVLAFSPLSRADVAEVARRLLTQLSQDLEAARGVRLDIEEQAIGALLDSGGFDEELGARPMRRAIARHIEAPIAEMILRGDLRRGDVALVDAENGKVVIDVVTTERASA